MRQRRGISYERGSDITMYDMDRRGTKHDKNSVPFYYGLGVLVLLVAFYGAVDYLDNRLPTPLTVADEKLSLYKDAFITERAKNDLKALTDLGPRVAGSHENEVQAVELLTKEIRKIILEAHTNQKIELDVQVVTGSYFLNNKPTWIISAYSNVQNIVVKMHSEKETNHSLLLNVHFDSVPTSPGGSDDGINVAVQMETLRKLSRLPNRPRNNVIFLFNGAEETGLHASHGFIAHHKWAPECKVVLNIEAAGAGGRLSMFQTGPNRPWISRIYGQVPHPSGHVSSEEIFQADLIPSDTDFRIFRDFGNTKGIDMAFTKDGYRYHTKYDGFENIPLGSYQHAGDNILFLTQTIADSEELSNEHPEEGNVVFFDVFGLFFVQYTTATAMILNLVTCAASIAVFLIALRDFKLELSKMAIRYLAKVFILTLVGWFLAALLVGCIAFFLDYLSHAMSWFRNNWLIAGLYVVPSILGQSIVFVLLANEKLNSGVTTQIQIHATRLIWTVVLLLGTILGIRSIVVVEVIVLFNTVACLIIHISRQHYSVFTWKILYLLISILPALIVISTARNALSFFIPLTGRIGGGAKSDFIIGGLTCALTILTTSTFIPMVTLLRQKKIFFASLIAIFITFFVMIFTPVGFPYSGDYKSPTPQRFWILHSRRVFRDEVGVITRKDGGFFFLNMDRNSPRSVANIPEIQNASKIKDDCEDKVLCGFPLAHPKMIGVIDQSTWIPVDPPVVQEPVELKLLSKTQISPTLIKYRVAISGPDRVSIYISPKKGLKMTSISLIDKLPEQELIWNKRQFYFIVHICGKETVSLEFDFEITVPDNFPVNNATTEIVAVGKYIHEKRNVKTAEYKEFLDKFPEWADLTAWLASLESWFV